MGIAMKSNRPQKINAVTKNELIFWGHALLNILETAREAPCKPRNFKNAQKDETREDKKSFLPAKRLDFLDGMARAPRRKTFQRVVSGL